MQLMCELLVCVKDRGISGNLAVDSHAPQQGDVVSVHEDGWAWGLCELGVAMDGNPNGNHPFFRVFKLPNVTVSQASVMLAPEVNTDPLNPSPYLQYRAKFFDKTKIPAGALATYWNDDTRSQPAITLPYTAAQLATIVSNRTPIPF